MKSRRPRGQKKQKWIEAVAQQHNVCLECVTPIARDKQTNKQEERAVTVTAPLFNILQRAEFRCWDLGLHISLALGQHRATGFACIFAPREFRESTNETTTAEDNQGPQVVM